MKNIHILPTHQPSRLVLRLADSKLVLHTPITQWHGKSQHIYISSDEEIKEGDLFLYKEKLLVKHDGLMYTSLFCKKIILTTDPTLIADGVQEIEDTFIEWLVKHPTSEFIETFIDTMGCVLENRDANPCINYKIKLPQEGYICPHTKIQCDDECCVSAEDCHITSSLASGIVDCEPEQETLGEYDIKGNQIMLLKEDIECVHMYLDDLELPRSDNKGEEYSIVGRVKRLEERMYSEEEVIGLCMSAYNQATKDGSEAWLGTFDKWFEQFKKK